jgi:hypothetical protein
MKMYMRRRGPGRGPPQLVHKSASSPFAPSGRTLESTSTHLFRADLRTAVASPTLTAALRSLMFEITAGDPRTTVGASFALVIATVAACALPAWRAGSVDPSITLRVE